MIRGIGIEAVDVGRFSLAMDRWGERLLKRLFTPAELSYCLNKRTPEKHLAARYAAKMSLKKALGKTVPLRDIEIIREGNGRPVFKALAVEGLEASLSMAHDGDLAIAQTIVEEK